MGGLSQKKIAIGGDGVLSAKYEDMLETENAKRQIAALKNVKTNKVKAEGERRRCVNSECNIRRIR